MHNCGMWKPDISQIWLQGVPPMELQQKKNIKNDIKIILGKDCVVEKVMIFLVEIFEEIQT